MNKRIGIVTWIGFPNFGTYLQAFALKKILENMGYTPAFIDDTELCNRYTKAFYDKKNALHKFLSLIYRPLHNFTKAGKLELDYRNERQVILSLYSDFREKFLPLTKETKDFGTIIAGSDQIWAPHFPLEEWYMRHYFLADFKGKKIAYAPSLGMQSDNEKEFMSMTGSWIMEFSSLSAREPLGARILSNIVGKEVPVLPDPTLLLDKEQWIDCFKLRRDVTAPPYCLCYLLTYKREIIEHTVKYAKSHGMRTVVILNNSRLLEHDDIDTHPAGPEEFLKSLYGASAFVTDSFHGAIFSLILQVPSAIYQRFPQEESNRQNGRIENLFRITGSNKRLLPAGKELADEDVSVDNASTVRQMLDRERKKAFEYLKTSIENAD